uniref:Uncharacterized protein n=1 Tax=Timema tahoe TaxID=61484 RepID=A0A7R9IG23_9NEOP|nr:unnamed protein product [Timema tahoe]
MLQTKQCKRTPLPEGFYLGKHTPNFVIVWRVRSQAKAFYSDCIAHLETWTTNLQQLKLFEWVGLHEQVTWEKVLASFEAFKDAIGSTVDEDGLFDEIIATLERVLFASIPLHASLPGIIQYSLVSNRAITSYLSAPSPPSTHMLYRVSNVSNRSDYSYIHTNGVRMKSDIPMVGNVFSFVFTKYPPEWRWSLIKTDLLMVVCPQVLMWLLAMLCGMILGKLLIHDYLCGRLLRLKMFRDDQGSWMTMFLTVIVSLYVFSHAYNLLLVLWYDNCHYKIDSKMAVTSASVMKAAACGTWLGDLITALMVTDMMLQDNLYPHWATRFRQLWRQSNVPRILIFWVGSVLATAVVVTLIVSDWISWDRLNRDFVATTELSRAFLASFILVMDLLIVMQDWDFPHFTTTLHVNLPGFSVATLQWKYAEVDITGKWFNYGINVMVMLLDLNMWKNQIFYDPRDFGQYTGQSR